MKSFIITIIFCLSLNTAFADSVPAKFTGLFKVQRADCAINMGPRFVQGSTYRIEADPLGLTVKDDRNGRIEMFYPVGRAVLTGQVGGAIFVFNLYIPVDFQEILFRNTIGVDGQFQDTLEQVDFAISTQSDFPRIQVKNSQSNGSTTFCDLMRVGN